MSYKSTIENYLPYNIQETKDLEVIRTLMDLDQVMTRENKVAHLTVSSINYNKDKDKILMVYHKIYNSWSWTGGHVDGMDNGLRVAMKELQEETGIKKLKVLQDKPIALDLLPVKSHYRKGEFVPAHLHFNLTYLFEVSEDELLQVKEDENTKVGWLPVESLEDFIVESHMVPVYKKILERVKEGQWN